jgi:hypothetical protein
MRVDWFNGIVSRDWAGLHFWIEFFYLLTAFHRENGLKIWPPESHLQKKFAIEKLESSEDLHAFSLAERHFR